MKTPVVGEMPPSVCEPDFRTLAAHAIEAGLFVERNNSSEEDVRCNNEVRFPRTMLDTAYGNGPARIQRGEQDVPTAIMHCVRKNFVEANKLLLPQESVLHYFHNRFVQDDVFDSKGIQKVVADYKPYINNYGYGPDNALSFKTEGVDRNSTQRYLFTSDERHASVVLARDHPELVLTLFGYQGILGDYIQKLHREFIDQPADVVNYQDLNDFEKFANQWGGLNFQNEFLPSIALFLVQAKRAEPDAPAENLVTQKLLSDAVQFILKNGSFRNHVTVPADVATDGVERVNHFSCPAIGTIREQLADGSLLNTIYRVVTKHIGAGDDSALNLCDSIKYRAEEIIADNQERKLRLKKQAEEDALPYVVVEMADKDLPTIQAEVISKVLLKQKPGSFTFEGVDYSFTPEDIASTLCLSQPMQEGDLEAELYAGDYYYTILEEGIKYVIQHDRAVFFSFNGEDNRIDPENLRKLLTHKDD